MSMLKRLVVVGVATISMFGVGLVSAPAQAAQCDDIDRPVCEAAAGVCFLLYKLHVNSDPSCFG